MNNLKVAIDMDGVIADWFTAAMKNIKSNWNIDFRYEDFHSIRTFDMLKKTVPELKDKEDEEIYLKVCPPGFFRGLDLYQGVKFAVKEISKYADIVFVTKPLEYKHSANEKLEWLDKHFSDIDYDVIFVKNGRAKGLIDTHFTIDDDPYVIENLIYQQPIIINRPWNLSYKPGSFNILRFDSLKEFSTHFVASVNLADSYIQQLKEEDKDFSKSFN